MKISFGRIFADGTEYYLRDIPGYLYEFLCSQLKVDTSVFSEAFTKVSAHYSLFSSVDIDFDVKEETTFEDVVNGYLTHVGINHNDFYNMNFFPSVITDNECVGIEDYSLPISVVLYEFNCGNKLRIVFFLSTLQGEVFNENGVSYYMHSNERTKHHIPHVHVTQAGEYDIVISIRDLSLLKGDISTKELRRIQEFLKDKQEQLISYWNNNTKGISIDVDFSLKYCGRER